MTHSDPFCDWLTRALTDGESVQVSPPVLSPRSRPFVIELLRAAFEQQALDVAGPVIAFDPESALEAAVKLARACWWMVTFEDKTGVPLASGSEPQSPADHLSADVCFRFLPAVYRRARSRDPGHPLTLELTSLLRRWPLSDVLADLDDGPTTPLEFGGHPGLQQLYAERLARTGRPTWVPATGPAREWVDRVFHELGKPVPVSLKENSVV
ncbi:hypothetical protein [Fimbriiglobus ruber]|uniref:hypothetical protein n=1 Tax=Fimbriiglobus ruber TaxID=1908690 RepID=UPI00117A2F7A|nr:hypothetical protein [Fimbriiglobus ruber]